jgi:hypothetical protein
MTNFKVTKFNLINGSFEPLPPKIYPGERWTEDAIVDLYASCDGREYGADWLLEVEEVEDTFQADVDARVESLSSYYTTEELDANKGELREAILVRANDEIKEESR